MMVPACSFSSRKVKTVDPWDLTTSQPSLISKLQIPLGNLSQKTRRAGNMAQWVRHLLTNLMA